MISAHLIHCGYCPKGQIVALTYADAEKQGWAWSERQGWRCPRCLAHKARIRAQPHHSVQRAASL